MFDDWIALTSHMPAISYHFNNPTFHDHSQRWHERARQLFTLAGEVAAVTR